MRIPDKEQLSHIRLDDSGTVISEEMPERRDVPQDLVEQHPPSGPSEPPVDEDD